MRAIRLTSEQLALIERPLGDRVFVEGPAGCGKTTVGLERMLYLMTQDVKGSEILVLTPQRVLGEPYFSCLRRPDWIAGGAPDILTLGGLARRMVELFWPLIAEPAGFAHPERMPTFLTLETAQYFMAHVVRPLLDQGIFASVSIAPNRLYSQVIDNLNKSAEADFPYTEIGERLKEAWVGSSSQLRIYDDAQECASRFRNFCLENNLLDFSLQFEIFHHLLWPDPVFRQYLCQRYRCLIADNIEEDTPVAHKILEEWLPEFESAMLIFDLEGGYRRFLGANPRTGYALKALCEEKIVQTQSFVTSPGLESIGWMLAEELDQRPPVGMHLNVFTREMRNDILAVGNRRFFPEMLDWAAEEIERLVREEGVSPDEIVVLAPYVSDALRYALLSRLLARGVPAFSHRPSRPLRQESAAQCLINLACLAHPKWKEIPPRIDVAHAFQQAISGLDLVRAQLLGEIVYRISEGEARLTSFDEIRSPARQRITHLLGKRYEQLRQWLLAYSQRPAVPLNYFFSRLFGEILSQPGFRFHDDLHMAEMAANLIESARKFRWALEDILDDTDEISHEFVIVIREGLIAAQYLRSWEFPGKESVLIAPAHTFLMRNRPVDFQFWLDLGSYGWMERVNQPLTQPYVLSREWIRGNLWTEAQEFAHSQAALSTLTVGLLRRCRRKVYLGFSQLGETGFEQRGPLLYTFTRIFRRLENARESGRV